MDFPLYPDYRAQVTGNPRVGRQPENPHVRATADDFDQSQLTRGSGYTPDVGSYSSLWVSFYPYGFRCDATGPWP
eukprot:3677656-Pyramimonas_sp.AAC.1